eukprot:Awhi_evm2s2643
MRVQNEDETIPHFLLKCSKFEGIRDIGKNNIENDKEFTEDVNESEIVEDSDLDDIIFNLPSDFFSDVSDSTDVDSGVGVSVPVVRNGVVGVDSEVVVVSSNFVALTKLPTKKNLVNCIDKLVFALWESRKDFLLHLASTGGVDT